MDTIRRIVFPRPFVVEHETEHRVLAPLSPDEIDFRTRFSLISAGTELAFYTGTHVGLSDPTNTFARYPYYPGYAAVGTVTAVGEAVTDFKVGDEIYGIVPHTSHARLTRTPSQPLLPIPASCPPQLAVFTRLAAIAVTAAAVAPSTGAENVMVLGGGLIGNLAAQVYALEHANVVIVERVAQRRARAQACSVAAFETAAQAREWLGADPDIVVEATGVPQFTNTALELVRRRGRVVLLGSPRGTVEMQIYQHIHVRGIQLCGAHEKLQGFDGLPSRLELSRRMLAAIVSGDLKIAPLHTDTVPAAEAAEAYERLRNQQALGVLLSWGD